MSFTHLHLHSHYSTLDGLGQIPQIIERTKEIGSSAVAITDHASISSLPEFFAAAKEAGIKPIIGCEFYVVENIEGVKGENKHHLNVLAKNWNGVMSIMRQLTVANRQFYGRPRLTFGQALQFEDCIVATACSFGMLSMEAWTKIVTPFAKKYLDDFYVEIMPLAFDGQDVVNKRAFALSDKAKIKAIATNDAHYVRREDAKTHDILLAIQTGSLLTDKDRFRFDTDDLYMKSEEEMVEAFRKNCPYLPEDFFIKAIEETGRVAEKINIEMPEFPVSLPSPYGAMDETVFGEKIADGWRRLIHGKGLDEKVYGERLIYEIGVIKKLGFIRYFLVVEDIISWSNKSGIMTGPGRGSAAGSLVSYLLGITQIDPIAYGLQFERFLNPSRVSWPDIDIDFQDDRRHEVFTYLRKKYGEDRTAQISTFGILKSKSAFRDVCRVYGIDMFKVNLLSKKLDDDSELDSDPDVKKFLVANPEIAGQVEKIRGTIRQCGIHAAGIVVADRLLEEVSVIERRNDGVEVINWDKEYCEGFGLIKMDILGLSTLSILARTKKLLKEHRDIDLEFSSIPMDDAETLREFQLGHGVAVFQFENGAIQKLLRDVCPVNFDQVADCTALFRPGSLQSGQTEQYVHVAQGSEYERYDHDLLRPILKPTLGQMVYQEQITRIFTDLGGFSMSEADKMRKIIGKKLGPDEFEKHRSHFVEGCIKNDVEPDVANSLFTKMVQFARYAFNKSHSVAYTAISWWTMWLKVHYPLEFMAATLSCSTKDDKIPAYVKECARLGIKVSLPDINRSTGSYEIDVAENEIVAPLGVIKNVGGKALEDILRAREAGPFLSREDFLARITKRVVNIMVQEALFKAGAFENAFGLGEKDPEQRLKNLNEYMPICSQLPSIGKGGRTWNPEDLVGLYTEISLCAKDKDRTILMPVHKGVGQPLMVINAPQTNEKHNLEADGTRYLLSRLKDIGLSSRNIYYANPVKCIHGKTKASGECESKCFEFIRREIGIIKPKLILCLASSLFKQFSGLTKAGAKDHYGKVIYSKEYDCFVLFGPSPQYAYYQEDAMPHFNKMMEVLGEIFA